MFGLVEVNALQLKSIGVYVILVVVCSGGGRGGRLNNKPLLDCCERSHYFITSLSVNLCSCSSYSSAEPMKAFPELGEIWRVWLICSPQYIHVCIRIIIPFGQLHVVFEGSLCYRSEAGSGQTGIPCHI